MTVWGIKSHIDAGEPAVIALKVNGPRSSMTGDEVFRHRSSSNDDWGQKLRALTADLETVLRGDPPDALIVRSVDWSRARREDFLRKRYHLEGAILASARRHIAIVDSKSGRELGTLCGSDKATVEAEAISAFGSSWKEAGSAAIGALVLAGQA